MGRSKTIASGISWTVIQNVVNVLYGIFSVPFLINYFGKEEYGLIGLALSVNVYIHLLDMGMTNSNVRFFSEYLAKGETEKVQKLFKLTHLFYLIIGVLNTCILFGVSFFTNRLFNVTPEQAITLRNLLWILALNATFSWISVCFDQFLRSKELISWIKFRSTCLKLLQFVLLALTISLKFSVEIYFIGYVFMTTVILPLSIIKIKKISPGLSMGVGFDKDIFKTVFPYALSIFSFSIFQFLALNFRPLFLGNISGPSAVADFSVMTTITTVVTVLSSSFLQVLLPIVTKLSVGKENDSIYKVINDGTKYVNLLLSFVVFLLVICINEVFTVYVGAEYTVLSKWMVLWLLAMLLSHRNIMTSLVFTETKLKSISLMGAIAMVVAIVLYILLIPKYGVGGAVIGYAAHELIHTLFYYCYFFPVRLKIKAFQILIKKVLPTWMLFGAVAFASQFCRISLSSVWWELIIKASISAVILFTFGYFLILNKEDKRFLKSILHIK